jgi:hypothetical protein
MLFGHLTCRIVVNASRSVLLSCSTARLTPILSIITDAILINDLCEVTPGGEIIPLGAK